MDKVRAQKPFELSNIRNAAVPAAESGSILPPLFETKLNRIIEIRGRDALETDGLGAGVTSLSEFEHSFLV